MAYALGKGILAKLPTIKRPSLKMKVALLIAGYAAYVNMKNYGLLPKKSITGQHVFITGAGSGIGRIMAQKFAKLGCPVTCADIDLAAAQETAQSIVEEGHEAIAVHCDVTSSEQVHEAGIEARKAFGSVMILVNNAGIVTGKKILDCTEREIEKTFKVNSLSHAYTVREFLPEMIKQDKGHIVSIASMAGIVGTPGLADYCGSKFAAFGFDESLRLELDQIGSKVRTTCVCPFFINTGMFENPKTDFPLLPLLDQEWVSQRIITAIQQNEQVLLLPWFASMAMCARGLLPTFAFDKLMNMVGVTKSMQDLYPKKQKKAKL